MSLTVSGISAFEPLRSATTLRHTIFQFQVHAEFALAGVAASLAQPACGLPEITLRRTPVQHLCRMRRLRTLPCYDVGAGVLLERPQLSLFAAFTGDEIRVEVSDEHLAEATNFIIGKGMAASTLFTGGLPLHAAGADFDGRLFGLLAPSGTGKSTTLRALLQAGALFASDDMIPVSFSGEQHTAYPAVSLSPKMHRTALEQEGISPDKLTRVSQFEEKFWLPLPQTQRRNEPGPLSALFVLQPSAAADDRVRVRRLSGIDAGEMLRNNLHGTRSFEKYVSQPRLQAQCSALGRDVPVYTLEYRKRFETLPRLTDAVRATLNGPRSNEAYF